MVAQAQWHATCCELIREVAEKTGEVRLRVAGASMLPTIRPGDILTVRSCHTSSLRPSQIILYHRDGKFIAHRILRMDGDRLLTRGDSVSAFDPPVRASEVVGRVIGVCRGSARVDPNEKFWERSISWILRRSDLALRLTLFVSRRIRRAGSVQRSWT